MYGQFCMIHKETDTVLAMTAVTGDMQGEMNVYYEEVLLHYPNQPLADFFDLTLSCENDIITLTDKEGEIRYLAGRAEWKKNLPQGPLHSFVHQEKSGRYASHRCMVYERWFARH